MLAALVAFAALSGAANGQSAKDSATANAKQIKLVAFGDSLTAGLGLPAASAFPARLEAALRARGYHVDVVNAGVSGDTVADGLARLDWSIPQDADAVIVELGANDALRGLDPVRTRASLDEIVKRLRQRDVAVMLAGMVAPPNLGQEYSAQFDPIYPDLAKAYDLPLYPFFLDGVAADAKLNQADGMHPTAEGVDIIVTRILPTVEALLTKVSAQRR
jgi:acyl-CoA thioesterase-1